MCGVVPIPLVETVNSSGWPWPIEQVFERVKRARRRHDNAECHAADLDDRRGVANRIPPDLARPGRAKHRLRHLRDRVAVGCGLLQHRHGQRAAGTTAVLDQNLLPQVTGGEIGQQTHGEVSGTARRPRHPQRDRTAWKAFGLAARSADAERRSGRAGQHAQHTAAWRHDAPPGRLLSAPNPR